MSVFAAGFCVGLTLVGTAEPAHALSLTFVRNIQTRPFVGTSTSMNDNEALTYVASEDRLWIADDSPGRVYEVSRATGQLHQVISQSELRSAHRYLSTELAGSSRTADIEALAYDETTDILYVFSGPCCSSSVKPTVFRLTRPARTGGFSVESWQPLSSPYNDLSGASVRDGVLWVGHSKTIVRYDYVTNTMTSPTVFAPSSIYGIGFGPGANDMWIAISGNRVIKYDFTTKQPVAGADFSMAGYGVRYARAVEPIGNELYISDGYDYYGSVTTAFGVRVFSTGATVAPVASFTYAPTGGTAPLTVDFTDTSTNAPTSWTWSWGDGTANSTTRNASHTFAAPGTYQVTLTASNSAGANTAAPVAIVVIPPVQAPVASFTASPTTGPVPLTVALTDTSTNTPTSWRWTWGDGTAAGATQHPTHTFTAPGTYRITLSAANAGGSSTSPAQTITVLPVEPPAASFTASPSSGAAPLSVKFTDTSTNAPTRWRWNWGDGTPVSGGRGPIHVFSSPGVYVVQLTATNSIGSSSTTRTITVSDAPPPPPPVASFTADRTSGTEPLTVSFTDTSTGAPTSWSWAWGDGTADSTMQNPSHEFTAAGTYDVVLTATNAGGSTTATRRITVSPAPVTPVASFNASVSNGSAPLAVSFTDTSTNAPTSWRWVWGDGTPDSTTQHATHTFTTAGVYNVTLEAANAAGSSTTAPFSITVTPPVNTTRTFTPVQDAYVDKETPTTPRGAGGELYCVTAGARYRAGYVMFDVVDLPATVRRATLRVWVTDSSSNGAAWFRVPSTTWSEGSLTFATAPPTAGAPLGNPAGVTAGTWVEIDVTPVVTGNGRVSFAAIPESSDQDRYSTREGVHPPELVVVTG